MSDVDLYLQLEKLARTRPKIAADLEPILKEARKRIGPYIRVNKRIWTTDGRAYGDGKFSDSMHHRMVLVDPKTGMKRKTTKEFIFLGDGRVKVYENHRRQPIFLYEDLGAWEPPLTKQMFSKELRSRTYVSQVARRVADQLAKLGEIDIAPALAGAVCEDANFHRISLPTRYEGEMSPGNIAEDLDWSNDVVFFAAALLTLTGHRSYARQVVQDAIEHRYF